MSTNNRFAEIAALAGDPARAAMLHALMDGRALTAGELARAAGITPQTASGHLNRMTTAGLIGVAAQGRHRYHRLASPQVARMLESIMRVAASTLPDARTLTVGPKDLALRRARTCYDHLAGALGVAIADVLIERGHVELNGDGGLVTESGLAHFSGLGIDLDNGSRNKRGRAQRVVCRPCLDWSERRPHIAGTLGAHLCILAFEKGWIRRIDGSRAVAVTTKGRTAFREGLGLRAFEA